MLLLLILGAVLLLAIVTFYGAFSWGFVAWKFWYWFLLPVFPALPAITFLHAVGLMFFISLFKNQSTQVIKDEYVDKTIGVIMGIIAPWVVFIMGWLIKTVLL